MKKMIVSAKFLLKLESPNKCLPLPTKLWAEVYKSESGKVLSLMQNGPKLPDMLGIEVGLVLTATPSHTYLSNSHTHFRPESA